MLKVLNLIEENSNDDILTNTKKLLSIRTMIWKHADIASREESYLQEKILKVS